MALTAKFQTFWQSLVGSDPVDVRASEMPDEAGSRESAVEAVEVSPNDPLVPFLLSNAGAVEIDSLTLDSPAVSALRDAGVKVSVPLISQGELIGLLNLGPHLSGQEYSTDDHRLLGRLANQAAPAVRVAQLVRQQRAEVRERERVEQELRVAQVIQQTLLPEAAPDLPGWQIKGYYQPAREVGGDFYDFFELPQGKLGLVIGDVTDKGVPAALVMATTRAMLRSAAEHMTSPGAVLQRVNNSLVPDIPANMFVTCLYAVLDPGTGQLSYANAGHDLPYRRSSGGIDELHATGFPLGLMPGMVYEEKETNVGAGESVLFYSDGLVEAHNSERDMFGFPRLKELCGGHEGGASLIEFLLSELSGFTGLGWEQEDDVTLVTLRRDGGGGQGGAEAATSAGGRGLSPDEGDRTLVEFDLPSQEGNERAAVERVVAALQDLAIPEERLESLKTAVAEATMNAMEHGNKYSADLPISIQVKVSPSSLSVHITDRGGGEPIPEAEEPDLEAKLEGLQSPRGWGLFLIEKMVDEMSVSTDDEHHTLELVMNLEGESDDNGAS